MGLIYKTQEIFGLLRFTIVAMSDPFLRYISFIGIKILTYFKKIRGIFLCEKFQP
jgi:hypothetical protein